MDFSPWDLCDSFRLHEAACLMAGVLPISKRVPSREELPTQAIPYYVKLAKAYFVGAYLFDRPEDERFQRETLLTGNSTDETGKPDIPHSTDALTGEMVSRAELQRWVEVAGIKSAYSFAPVATSSVGAKPGKQTGTPDPERRLTALRSLGGTAKYSRGEWKFTGIAALVASEKDSGRKRSTEKTIRADLKEAAESERDNKAAGFFNGLEQR